MQDGGQVSSDLIKELPSIRNMLEKSPFSTNGHALTVPVRLALYKHRMQFSFVTFLSMIAGYFQLFAVIA